MSSAPPFIEGLTLTCAAYRYAEDLHEGQRRSSDKAPFILHPLEVAVLLHNRDFDDEVVAAGRDVQAMYAADKVAKSRELRAELTREPTRRHDPDIARRLEHYAASLEMLESQAPDLALVRQLRFELWALRHLPPPTR